jgi:truncated hemoglobin YjbI
MEQKTLFERLGGAPVIEKLIVALENKIKADSVIGPFHKKVDFQKLNEQRRIYFTRLFGGQAEYTGKNLSEAHKSLDLKDAHFTLFITLFRDALAEQNIDQELINETVQLLETTRREIVQKKSLFERIGGDETIAKVLEIYTQKSLADPVLRPLFEKADLQKINEIRRQHFAALFGGKTPYSGKINEARPQGNLNDSHFDRVLYLFEESLAELKIEEGLIREAIEILKTTKYVFLNQLPLFVELGGFEAIDKVLIRLQEKILADPTLAPYHANVDFKKLNESRRFFFASVFGGPRYYFDRDLKTAHSTLKISDQSFNVFLKYLRQAFLEIGTKEELINNALRILDLTRDDVLGKKSVFERLGGKDTLYEIVTKFHESLLQDNVLGPFYQKADLQRAIKNYAHYLTHLFGGFGIQDSTSLKIIHGHVKLTDVHYDLFVKIFNQTLTSFKLDKEVIDDATKLVEKRRDEVLQRQSLWTRLGGEEFFDKAVGRFIEKIISEPHLKQAHQHIDLKKYHENHKDFFAHIYGGYHFYTGKDLKEVHGPLQLKDEHFNVFINLFRETLLDLGVKEDLVKEAIELIELRRNEILNRISLYERLGGEQGIELLVEKLNNNLANDPVLAPFHKDVDWTKLHQHRKQFFIQEFGGLNVYTGKDIRAVHSSYKLNDEQFNLFIKNFKDALVELKIKEDLIQEAVAHLETKRREILNQAPLFEKLGGKEGLEKFVQNLDNKILADPKFAKFFEKTDLTQLHNHHFQFFLNLFGGRDVTYQGKSLRSAHGPFPLSDEHFKGFLGHAEESLAELGTEKPIIEEVVKVFESTRNEVLNQ